jgi:hypothetical protein
VLRRQSAIRLQFPYPIVQEYLAACYLVRERPDTLTQRIADAVQRPWAQVVQFALELHPTPAPIIRSMLARQDDAFATGLRLVARCVVNGARVDADLRGEIARRLTKVWSSASWLVRERVGHLMIDGFSKPLLPEIRDALGYPWLIASRAGEIVTRADDRALTEEVLSALLERGLHRYMALHPLQPALHALGDTAIKLYAGRARRPGITEDQLSGLSNLIGALDPKRLTPGLALDLALDEALPDEFRLNSFCVTGLPLDNRAWPIIERALRSDDFGDRWAALKALSVSERPIDAVLDILRDPSFTEYQRKELASHLGSLFPDLEKRMELIHRCVDDDMLPKEVRDMMATLAARYGNRIAFENLISRLPTLSLSVASTTIALFGHYPFRPLGLRAAEAVRSRVTSASEAAVFAYNIAIGMTSIYEMDSFQGGALRPSPRHPAFDVWAEIVDSWAGWNNSTEIQRLNILVAAVRLGSGRAIDALQSLVNSLADPDHPRFDAEDSYGNSIRAAIDEVRRKRRLLPLEVCERFARAARPNVPYAGISVIAAHADRAALDLLIRLHNDPPKRDLQSTLSESIEPLAARLGLTIVRSGQNLKVA